MTSSSRSSIRETSALVLVVGFLCTLLSLSSSAAVSTTPLLTGDDFDTSNKAGAVPTGWKVSTPTGASIRVVDTNVTDAASAPYCIELIDNSSTGRPEMYRDFTPSESGRASASFKLKSPATAHAALQLRSARGTHLCSVVFTDNKMMRYEGAEGNTPTETPWTEGEWQTVKIEWFNDFTYSASVGDAQFAQRAHFATNALPGKIYVTVGYGSVTNKIGYVDDVKVVGGEGH